MSRLPDYLIIGGQRCGTTSMYDYISSHPGAVLPRDSTPMREIHFFDYGKNYKRGMKWYKDWFTAKRGLVTGDDSPTYLHCPYVPERVKKVCPNTKFIVLLRDPVDRAYSDYWKARQRDREPLDSFEAAIDAEEGRLAVEKKRIAGGGYYLSSHHLVSYLDKGHYAEQLERWFEHFPREQFLVVQSEALFESVAFTMLDVWEFLGLSQLVVVKDYKRWQKLSYPPMETETRERLAAYFRPRNRQLEALLGRRFGWR